MSAEPKIQTRAEQPYVAIRTRVPMSGLAGVGARLGEVFDWLAARGVPPAGPPFFKYNVIDMAEELEVEAGVPVVEPAEGDSQIISAVLPAGRYAMVSHVGHPDKLLEVTSTAAAIDPVTCDDRGVSGMFAAAAEASRVAGPAAVGLRAN